MSELQINYIQDIIHLNILITIEYKTIVKLLSTLIEGMNKWNLHKIKLEDILT